MMEIYWGAPLTLVVSPEGATKNFSTIEQARYWLRKKWPIADQKRECALERIDAAMHCLAPVGAARNAFIAAAKTAGFRLETAKADASPAL